jgi:hypothetical protein
MTGKNKNGSWAFQYLINLKGAMNSSRLINKKRERKETMKTQRNPDCMALNCTAPVDLIAKVRTAVEDIKVPCWTRSGHRPSRHTRTMSVSQFVVEAIAKAVAGIEASPENIEWAREKKAKARENYALASHQRWEERRKKRAR